MADRPVPAVCVVMPVYNGDRYLLGAIDSVLASTFRDFEFVIVDDGSDDGTADVLAGVTDPRVRVIRQDHAGVVSALNAGVAASRAELIARADADDVCAPDRLALQVRALRATDVDVLGTAFITMDAAGTPQARVPVFTEERDLRWALRFGSPLAHGSVTMRRSAFEAAGGYAPNTAPAEDYDLWVRLAEMGARIGNLPQPLYFHRSHGQSVSASRAVEQHERATRLGAQARRVVAAQTPGPLRVLRAAVTYPARQGSSGFLLLRQLGSYLRVEAREQLRLRDSPAAVRAIAGACLATAIGLLSRTLTGSTRNGPSGAVDLSTGSRRLRSALAHRRDVVTHVTPSLVAEIARETWVGRRERQLLQAARAGRDVCWTDTDTEPLVTIRITTSGDQQLLLTRAIPSATAQTYCNIEILVVGENVGAATVDALRRHPDPRVRFIDAGSDAAYPKDAEKRWMVGAWNSANLGIQSARGAWIAPCDDDDELTSDHVETLLRFAQARRREFVHSRTLLELGGNLRAVVGHQTLTIGHASHGSVLYSAGLRFFRYNGTSYLRREPLDINLFRRMRRAGVRMGYLPIVTYIYYPGPHTIQRWRSFATAALPPVASTR